MILNFDTKFVIYGVGEVGNNLYNKLVSCGYNVVAGLDGKKSGRGLLPKVNTYKLGEDANIDKDNVCVVLCLADGLIHKDVAYSLHVYGYNYIVFLPINFCLCDEKKYELTEQYNRVLNCNFKNGENINKFETYIRPDLTPEQSIVRDLGDECIVLCPVEVLYSESLELWNGDLDKIITSDSYMDRPIVVKNPRKNVFDYLAGVSENADLYFKSKKSEQSDEQKRKQIEARAKLFSVYEHEYDKKSDFFIEGAPSAIWNPKNYWNIVGGNHRTTYLLHKGHTIFPIKVHKSDFDKWINIKAKRTLEDYIEKNDIDTFWAPIPNPGFINFPATHERSSNTMIEAVLSELDQISVKNETVLDMLDDEGYFARVFSRMGANSSFVNKDTKQQEKALLIADLLYQNIDVVTDYDNNNAKIVLCKVNELDFAKKYLSGEGILFAFDEKELEYGRTEQIQEDEIYRKMSHGMINVVRMVNNNV